MVTEDWGHVRHSLRTYGLIVLGVSVPVVAILIAFSEPLVRLFFERGEFNQANTAVVTTIQRFSLLGIPPAMLTALLIRLISSMKANHLLLRAAGFAAVVNLVFDLILTRSIGIAGITLSTAIVQFSTVFYLVYLMRTGLPASRSPEASRATAS
jgi:putative peptidoglycan lipid II flippase